MPNTPPACNTSVADASARSLALPPSRRIGICPTPRKNHAVFGSSKYSALATNVTRRRITSGMKTESRNDRWFEARITGPRRGRCSRPSTFTRKHTPSTGVSAPLTTQYSKSPSVRPLAAFRQGILASGDLPGFGRLGRDHRIEPARQGVDLGEDPVVLDPLVGGVVEGPLRAQVVAQGTPGPGESGLHPDLHRQIVEFP